MPFRKPSSPIFARPQGGLNAGACNPRLWSAATSIWALTNQFANSAIDLKKVNDLTFGATTAQPRYIQNVFGSGLNFDGADTASATITAVNAWPVWIAGSFSVTNATAAQGACVALGSAAVSSGAFLDIEWTGATFIIRGQIRNVDSGTTATMDVVANARPNRIYHCALVSRSASSHTFFVNGKSVASTTNIGGSWTNLVNAALGNIKRSTAAAQLLGTVYWGAYGTTDPGDSFFQQLSVDPFGMIFPQPHKRRIISQQPSTAITFDAASNSGYQTAQSTYSWNHTCTGSSRYLLVGVSMLSVGGSSVSSITYAGVSMVLLRAKASLTGAIRSELWGLVAPTTGTNSIAVTLSAALDSAGSATSLTNVNQSLPTEGANDASATNVGAADATVNVTSVADNDWAVDNVATDDTAITVGAGQTQRANTTGTLGSGAMSTEGPQTPAGTITMSWTNVAALATWSTVSVALRPLSASGALFSRPLVLYQAVNRASTF